MKTLLLLLAPIILHMNLRLRCVGAFVTSMRRARDGHHPGGSSRTISSRKVHRVTVPGASPSKRVAVPGRSPPKSKRYATSNDDATAPEGPPLYLEEGLLAVHKPLTWSSNDVVSYIRGILIRDAKERGADKVNHNDQNNNNNKNRRYKKKKGPLMKVGHGGTLDPLASGVLVLGVGKGTSSLQSYLNGDKHYTASCELGYETDTLDAEGKLLKSAPWDHVKAMSEVEALTPKFTGRIEQVPPLYSAIRVDGKRLYEIARKDPDNVKAEDLEIPKREVEIHEFQVCTSLEESVIKSGVVDGPKYREAIEALEKEAAAKEAAAKEAAEAAAAEKAAAEKAAAEGATLNNDGNDSKSDNANIDGEKTQEGDGNESDGSKNKKRGRRNRKNKKNNNHANNFKKNLFNEENVPSIPLPSEEPPSNLELPRFAVAVKCGGGTYMRSLVRDIGYELNTVATMTGLVRTKQGPFVLEDCLDKDDWTPEKIYEAIRKAKKEKNLD
mmetsp:Transcript_21455/g.36846  ORF Transcript_21455/g.36846 Transcript_21455/m.36846 type:complete len:497 (+) Transcript_21455:69-1559(+)